jgi:hypothetical protein
MRIPIHIELFKETPNKHKIRGMVGWIQPKHMTLKGIKHFVSKTRQKKRKPDRKECGNPTLSRGIGQAMMITIMWIEFYLQ